MSISNIKYPSSTTASGGFYSTDGLLSSDRTVDLNGKVLHLTQGGSDLLLINPVSFTSSISATNGTAATNISAYADLIGNSIFFNVSSSDGLNGYVEIVGDAITKALSYTANNHNIFGNFLVNSLSDADSSNEVVITPDPSDWTIVYGTYNGDAVSGLGLVINALDFHQDGVLSEGQLYNVSFNVTGLGAATIHVHLGDNGTNYHVPFGDGPKSFLGVYSDSGSGYKIRIEGHFTDAVFTNISIKAVTEIQTLSVTNGKVVVGSPSVLLEPQLFEVNDGTNALFSVGTQGGLKTVQVGDVDNTQTVDLFHIFVTQVATIEGVNGTRIYIDDGGNQNIQLSAVGGVGINMIATSVSPLAVAGLTDYANNAAAVSGGLTAGMFYYTNVVGDGIVKVVI